MDERSSPVTGATDQDDAFLLELPGQGYIAQNNKRRTPSSFDTDGVGNAGCPPAVA